MARISTLTGGTVDVSWPGDVVGVEMVGVVGDADALVGAGGPAGSGEPAQLASVAAMAVIVAAATGVAVRARTLRMPPPAGVRPVVLRSITLMGHHTRPIVPTGAAAGVKTSTGGLRPCVGSRSSPAPGCHLVWARSQSGGTLGRLCAAPHLEAPHDPRRRLETGERRGSSSTTAQPAPRSPAPWGGGGRWSSSRTTYRTFLGPTHSGRGPGPALAPPNGPRRRRRCVGVWGRGPLRRGVGQRGAASGCGAGAYCVGVWRRGGLRRNVEHGIGAPRCPSTRPVALAGPPGWGCAGCGAARVGLRWMWGRPGGAALDVGPLGWKCAWRGAGGAGT